MTRILAALALHTAGKPNAVAVSGDHVAWTWAQLSTAVDRAVEWLEERLPAAGGAAPVAIALDNGPAWVVLDLALMALGRPCVPLPPFFTPPQRRHALSDSGACMLVRPRFAAEPGFEQIGGAEVVAESLALPRRKLHVGTDKITYTSGSTEQPKGVCLSLRQMEGVASSVVKVLGREMARTHMAVLPLGVLLENVAGLYPTILAGGRYHAPSLGTLGFGQDGRPDFARLCAAILEVEATSLILVPEILRGVTARLLDTGSALPSLSFVAVGGAKVSPQLIAEARGAGLPAYEGYGLSECASVVTLNTPRQDRPGSVGRVLPHLRLSVAGDGELIVSPKPFLGYVGQEACGGGHATGDLGGVDADGFVNISGRKSNLLITAFGRNVAPEWVESELLAQPEIGQALVFGEGASALCAVIVPASKGVRPEQLEQAVARANLVLPDYAQVRRWRISRPFDPGAGELTGNGRPRRAVLHAAHQDFIENHG